MMQTWEEETAGQLPDLYQDLKKRNQCKPNIQKKRFIANKENNTEKRMSPSV